MKAPISWLKQYVDIDVDVETLCEKMVSIGFEIESVEYLGNKFSNVKVGQITEITKHPDADKLQVCQVNMGEETIQIITAAKNVFVGAKVPVSLHGARLADGTIIKNGKLRGLASNGMFCGGDELGITNANYPNAEVDGILILDDDTPIGEDMVKVLGLDDYVLDFSITFNRPDCNSIYGLAREVAVALGKKVKPLEIDFVEDSTEKTGDLVCVTVRDGELCPAYYMQGATDITVAPSPLWMTRRLAACGINAINNLVDITNYVLLEVGQPMHAFDYNDINDKTIIVRRAANGEKIIPFNQKEYELNDEILVIADKQRPVGLAGVMGGSNSGIKNSTKCVMFESAKFNRENIRRTSRALSIRTDSSSRFEKGVDSYTSRIALSRALHLINQLGCGKVTAGRISVEQEAPFDNKISFKYDRIENLLGIKIEPGKVIGILDNLGIETKINDGIVNCVAPLYREDLQRDCDYIEEIIRVYGYDSITSTLLKDTKITAPTKTTNQKVIDGAIKIFVGLGYNQCITYTFGGKLLFDKMSPQKEDTTAELVRILNPLGEEFAYLRQSVLPHLLSVAADNQSRKNRNLKLFEISKTFFKKESQDVQPNEVYKLCFVNCIGDFYDAKADIQAFLTSFGISVKYVRSNEPFLHPGVSADMICGEEKIGFIGELHPVVKQNFDLSTKVCVCEINLDKVINLKHNAIKYKAIPRLPSVDRDIAVVVDKDVFVQDIIDAVLNASKICESVELFDVYEGEQVPKGKKSVALSLKFRVSNRTLTDKDIDPQIKRILKILEEKFGAILR